MFCSTSIDIIMVIEIALKKKQRKSQNVQNSNLWPALNSSLSNFLA